MSFSKLLSENASQRILIFSKSYCPFCKEVKRIFDSLKADYCSIELDIQHSKQMDIIQDEMKSNIGARTVPQVFIDQNYIGDCSTIKKMFTNGELQKLLGLNENKFKLAVIGGGSGGVAAIKKAANLSPKDRFVIFDYVSPTPNILKTKWDIGGCCVNVGCIPKKLFHKAGLIGHSLSKSEFLQDGAIKSNWQELRSNINMYIRSLNFATKSNFMQLGNVEYINAKARLINPNEISYIDTQGKEITIQAENVLLATGTRPLIPDYLLPLKEHVITSDDLFWMPYEPGNTLIVGGGYVAVECACFLASIGYKVTLVVRDIALRSFDRECSDLVIESCRDAGVDVRLGTKISQINLVQPADSENMKHGSFSVQLESKFDQGKTFDMSVNTVLVATGRYAETSDLYNSERVSIDKNVKNNKLYAINEETNVPNVYVIGDILSGTPELTPVAVAAGRKLANRLLNPDKLNDFMDYDNIATTIFSHDEYATVGLSEEKANEKFGCENILIYKTGETVLDDSSANVKFGKFICLNDDSKKVLGVHFIGRNVGELIQIYSLLMLKGLNADSLLNHPDFAWVCSHSQSPIKRSAGNNNFLEPGKYAVLS